MRICLVDNRRPGPVSGEVAGYVAELGPVLAEDHKVTILALDPQLLSIADTVMRLRRTIFATGPEIVHLNNVRGLLLAAVRLAVGSDAAPFQPALVLGLHDDRLRRRSAGWQRRLTGSIRLVVSPSARLLDEHLADGFFAGAMHIVIPYGMPYHAAHLVEAYRRVLIDRRTGDLGRAA